MTHPSLVTQDLTIRFGGHVAVDKVSCAFRPGELTVIVGPNGAGKTTDFNLISGQLPTSEGRVLKDGVDLTGMSPSARAHHGIGRAFQLTDLFPALSVLENIRLAVQAHSGHGWRFWGQAKRFTELTARAERYLEATKLERVAHLAAALPHGDQRKLEVALLMAMEPDIYMFDEPTAGMSLDHAPDVLELISELKHDHAKTILLVEHKMDVVRALADRIIVLHNGELLVDGKPDEVMASDIVRDVYLGKSPRHTGERGMSLLTLEHMRTDIGQYAVLHDVSLTVPEGGVFVLLGRNGAGKTTTLRSIMGLWRPSPGSVRFRGQDITGLHTADIARLGIAYVPENMGVFGGLTVEENLVLATAKGTFDQPRLARIKALFPALGTFWTKQAWALSGGQKQMLAVARAIIEPRALILVDEPTKGLAPTIVESMAQAFREISESTTILLVEQNFDFARALGDRMAVIDDGRIAHAGTMDGFVADTALQARLLSLSA